MTRCDYDAVFYRVFCVTLLAIAFTFSVILTNVFIDIDGLLASKKGKHNVQMNENIIHDEFNSETTDNDDINYGENDDSYRTKRSIETQNFLFHIKNPKIKNILTNRLTTLLEELDAEEAPLDIKAKELETRKSRKDMSKDVEIVDVDKLADEKKKKLEKDDDMLHLTMHNILLQGIIGHMDLSDVYKRVHSLMDNNDIKDIYKSKQNDILKTQSEESKLPPRVTIEEKFFNELVHCKELQEQILEQNARDTERQIFSVKAAPNLLIKTVIDITSIGNEKPKGIETKNTKENIKGIIELIYNGKTIKFSRPDVDVIQMPQIDIQKSQKKEIVNIVKPKPIKVKKLITETTTAKDSNNFSKIPKSYMNKFVEEYFKQFPQENRGVSTEVKEKIETKRLKRHIKIKYANEEASKEKNKRKKKAEDDELYVEIETHFDSKGLKGEKKKKLIRSLIEKIQKAIHSDMDGKLVGTESKKKKHKQLHVRKRLQNPLEHKDHILINKYTIPLSGSFHRQLDPITKTVPMQESSPFIGGRSGEEWKKPNNGPSFLTGSKSINSAEMSEVDVDYSKVLDINGIPQRLQRPLNTELSEETMNANSYYDIGNMKFFIKDIDGSGFSIGFNQYVDEPPDPDTMKLFSGLENVIRTYHQNYDPTEATTEALVTAEENLQETTSSNNDHIIVRRSVNEKRDYHSNEYKIIFNDNFLPYENYRDIFERKKFKTNSIEVNGSNKHVRELPLIVDENILDKNLKPAEIFGLANLFERKKRSMTVKKISNLKSKIKLNRYLNTKAMSTKRIYLNKKRNKRQINKIRIIATDLPHLTKHSDENIFVVSDENVFADRAIVKEVETSEIDHDKQDDTDYIPYQTEDTGPSSYVTKIFDGRSRHNPLMAKYPHIFMEEISRSREEYIPDNALLFGKIPGLSKLTQDVDVEKVDDKMLVEQISSAPIVPNVTVLPKTQKTQKTQDVVNALASPSPKTNYKVTVKIVPKNNTGLNSGFKEIHTSINKRFNKNGLLYSTLVNVSEISKVVKLNRSKDAEYKAADEIMAKRIREQQEKMQMLLKQHARHIKEQLNRLNEEKMNLDTIIVDGDNNTDFFRLDYVDGAVPSKSQKVQFNKDEEKYPALTMHRTQTTTIAFSTTPAPVFNDKIKNNIISTIERNENLTDQILKKIDLNTDLLQTFLKKLTDKIDSTTAKPSNVDEKVTKLDMNSIPPEWRSQGVSFNQNMVIRKNDSHISIPFVYAYQQPILPHKTDTPIASVVYHGHIHTNTIHPKDTTGSAEKDKPHTVPKISEANNQSRFFIDELENDYKVIQVGDVKKNRDYNMVNGNGTQS